MNRDVIQAVFRFQVQDLLRFAQLFTACAVVLVAYTLAAQYVRGWMILHDRPTIPSCAPWPGQVTQR